MADLGDEVTRRVPYCSNAEGGTPALREPTPYEVDDFQAIAIGEVGIGPLCPRDDVEVQFDGDAVLLHAKVFDQIGQGDGGEVLLLAVDGELHCGSILARNRGMGKSTTL
jgi:hypothetical protein